MPPPDGHRLPLRAKLKKVCADWQVEPEPYSIWQVFAAGADGKLSFTLEPAATLGPKGGETFLSHRLYVALAILDRHMGNVVYCS